VVAWIGLHVLAFAAIPVAAAVGPSRPVTVPSTAEQVAPPPPPQQGSGSSDLGLVPDAGYGPYPAANYEVTFKHGHSWDFARNLMGGLIVLVWSIDKTLVCAGLWLIGFAFNNGIITALRDPFLHVGQTLGTNIVGPLRLASVAWFVLVVVCGWHALRGRFTVAVGELAVSVIAAGLFGVIAANPAGYLQGSLDTAGNLSGAVLSSADTNQHAPPANTAGGVAVAVHPAQQAMFKAFIDEPYQVIQWGHVLTVPACAEVNRKALARENLNDPAAAVFGIDTEANADWARGQMAAAGCKPEAAWANNPSAERLGAALISMFVAAVVLVLLGAVALTVIVAVVTLAGVFGAAVLVAPFAVLPGAGRAVLWRWIAAVVRVLLAVIGMAFLLVVLCAATTGLLASTQSEAPIVRFVLVAAAVVFAFLLRKRIVHAGANAAQRLAEHLSTRRPGTNPASPARWVAPAAAGVTGLAVGRELAAAHRNAQGAMNRHRAAQNRHRAAVQARHRTPVGTTARGRETQSALSNARIRAEATAPGRLIAGVGRHAATAATTAGRIGAFGYKATLGLPVHGPRAYHSAKAAGSARYQELSGQLRAHRAEYAANLRRLGDARVFHLRSEHPDPHDHDRP
jgi:hypothetical protein